MRDQPQSNLVNSPDSVFPVTFFKTYAATATEEGEWSLNGLARHIAAKTATEKKQLPWLKLATFGTDRTEARSLRHDANVLAVSGVEADYDLEVTTFEDAVDRLTNAGVLGIVYTSPSHTEDKPRWRVLCPLSAPVMPSARAKLLGRLNGLYRGGFSAESWALSQSYYYGSVGSNPSHQVEVVDGTPLDLHDELDEIWKGKPDTAGNTGGGHSFKSGRLNEAELLAQIARGESYHAASLRLLGQWARAGMPFMDARRKMVEAMEAVPEAERDGRWRIRFDDIDRGLDYVYGKEAGKRDRDGADDPPPTSAPPADEYTAAVDAVVARFNKLYLMVNENGRAVIYQPAFDPVLRRRRFDRMSPRDLQTLYMNERIQVGVGENEKPIYKGVADLWLRHPDRRQFIHGVTFDPGQKERSGVLNLWEGYGVQPAAGDWSLLRAHIFKVICAEDQIRYNYLMRWLARMLQRPAEAGEVAVVLKGGEGVGKGTLAKAIKRIVAQHALAISNAKHLTGNFNAHLRDVVFLFADEAFFAGDRAHVGVLKAIITEPYLTVEAKYANAAEVPNYLHVMMASNEEWVVPAAMDSRRFFVLVVPDTVRNNHDYFGAIAKQMDEGGDAAMLHDLLQIDLANFNVRAVPTTEGLQEQRKLSLGTNEQWWLDCLERGYVFRSKLGLDAVFRTWHPMISTDLLFASYEEYAKSRGERRPLSREGLGKFLTGLNAIPSRPQRGFVGEHLTDVETGMYGGTTRKAKPVEKDRPPGYSFGTLAGARGAFVAVTKLAITWDGGAEDAA